jgi:hypothetical protein
LLEEKFHGEVWFRLVKQRHGMQLYPRENIAPLVGSLNSTEDQAARLRALIGAHHRDGLRELAQRVLKQRR